MALDGTVISCMAWELNHALAGGKINKIAQPEKDELMLTIKNNRKQYRLLVSASASLPLVYLTDQNKTGPMTAPNFCMLLRKHIGSGRILRIWQPGMERILNMEIEHLNELGDICRKLLIIELMGKHSNIIFCQEDGMILDSIKHVSAQVSSVREVLPGRMYFIPETQHKYDPQTITEEEFFSSVCQKPMPLSKAIELGDICRKLLIIELMGKHSNIIFCQEDGMILDSIKHVSAQVSSVREVLPGRMYFIPETQHKYDPQTITEEEFFSSVCQKPMPLSKAIYTTLTGISPLIAEELCHRSNLESDQSANSFQEIEQIHLFHTLKRMMEDLETHAFTPNIVYDGKVPLEYAAFLLTQYQDMHTETYDTMSEVLERYYAEKNTITRIRQKSSDLRRIVQTALDRSRKKYDLQKKQLKDTEKRDKFRIYGELLNTYGYEAVPGSRELSAVNYYTGETVKIPLDPTLTAQENAKKYFDRYGKLKRTYEALEHLIKETKEEIQHLESISTALDIALNEEDLVQVKEELTQYGYIRRKYTGKRVKITSKPFHYLSSDGYDIYVGKNNYQNEELTFKFATGNDWWFHAKGAPGSHVIVKAGQGLPPDRTFEEAARLAAWYSSHRGADKVEVDYVEKKQVKKVNGGKPGFVIYHTNYSMVIDSDISGIRQVKEK